MAQMTLRLSEEHERMLEELQRRHPGVSRQKLFESLLERSSREEDESITSIAQRIEDSNPARWRALRSR